jgi:hypothetical protein
MGVRRGIYRAFVEKRNGKRKLGSIRCRWEDYINIDLQEM